MKNTDNTYIIDVRNTQVIDGVTDEICERAEGKYYERGGKKYIMYKSADEGDSYSTTVIVRPGGVTIKRTGGVNSNMLLDADRPTFCLYSMPYGKINMEIQTESIISDLSAGGGELRLKYTLIIGNDKYYNDMTIHVTGGN